MPGSGNVIGITALPDGTLVGISKEDNQLFTRATLASRWFSTPGSVDVIGITALPDGTLVGISKLDGNQLFTRATLAAQWVPVPDRGAVIGITALPNGTIVGIGLDNQLNTRATLNSPWVPVPPGIGGVIGITALPDGTFVGIGGDFHLYTRATLTSAWVLVPGSGDVIGITVAQLGAFDGDCLIRRVGINSMDGQVHFELKALDGRFEWTEFLAKQEHNREILAIALAAMASNKNVHIQTEDASAWKEVWWFDIVR